MRYQFTGSQTEVFPTIVTELGTLVCEPGDTVDLATSVDHPRLVAVKASKDAATHVASSLADVAPEVDPVPGPDQSTTEV